MKEKGGPFIDHSHKNNDQFKTFVSLFNKLSNILYKHYYILEKLKYT